MKFSNTLTILAAILLLTACDGTGSGIISLPDCLFCFPEPAPVTLSANAGRDQIVTEGDTVELTATATAATNCYAKYEWTQTSGPDVQPLFAVIPNLTFETPPVSDTLNLNFQLKATCRDGSTAYDSVSILLQPTSVSAVCVEAPVFATTYAWLSNGCTTNSSDIARDSRVATIYRQDEAEPNDSYESANPLTFPARIRHESLATDAAGFVSGMQGAIVDDSDFYIFTPPETGNYEIFLCNDPLVCTRGTVSNRWILELRDQNFNSFASTNRNEVQELKLRVALDAGLPYYVWVHVFEASSATWEYNLTIMSDAL